MRAGRKGAVFYLLLLLLPTPALSQSLKPLRDAIRDGSEETYPVVRCAALYLSVLEWAGEDRLGPETSQRTKLTVANLLKLATTMPEPSAGSEAEASVLRDIRAISDIYLDRYRTNYASVGEAFGQDELWSADSDVCLTLFGS